MSTEEGKIEYVAVSPYELKEEMDNWYHDLSVLLKSKLSYEEVFYFAAYLHLTFVKIHPWNDGNGRSARLIEKWYIAQHFWVQNAKKTQFLVPLVNPLVQNSNSLLKDLRQLSQLKDSHCQYK